VHCASQRESFHIFFNMTMSEAKETITIEDEPEDDDTEELYQLVFLKTEETCPIARSHFLCTNRNLTVSRVM